MLQCTSIECRRFESHPRQLIFLRKSDCLGCAVLLCLVCLFDLACFFLSSFSSLIKNMYIHVHVALRLCWISLLWLCLYLYIHVCVYNVHVHVALRLCWISLLWLCLYLYICVYNVCVYAPKCLAKFHLQCTCIELVCAVPLISQCVCLMLH